MRPEPGIYVILKDLDDAVWKVVGYRGTGTAEVKLSAATRQFQEMLYSEGAVIDINV